MGLAAYLPVDLNPRGSGDLLLAAPPQPLAGATWCCQVMVKADNKNAAKVLLGVLGNTLFRLYPGDAATFPLGNLANLWVDGQPGDSVSFLYWA